MYILPKTGIGAMVLLAVALAMAGAGWLLARLGYKR